MRVEKQVIDMSARNKIYWVDINRFDLQPDKSTYLEMADALNGEGYVVEILTGYGDAKYRPEGKRVNVNYFRSLDVWGLFRWSLQLNIVIWLLWHGRGEDIYILHPGSLWMVPLLRLFSRKKIHLDVRSVPVDIHSLKDRLDYILFWTLPLRLCGKMPTGYSFITDRLRIAVEQEIQLECQHYVIWQSGVNTKLFHPSSSYIKNREDYVLFYHGTITDNRGIFRVIQAMACLQDRYLENIRFVVVGAGSGYDRLTEVTRQEGMIDKVILKGQVPYEQIPDEIAKADCCICPLPALPEWNMSSPLKMFEYMASGKPVVLTPIPAHKDVLDDQNFVEWTTGDTVEDIKQAIENAYDNRESLGSAALQAPAFVRENYEWKSQGKKLARYLNATFGGE